jgi:hypothetical protein
MSLTITPNAGNTMGGGDYGGGGGGIASGASVSGLAANGAIRIIWPGSVRTFPYFSGK